MTEAIEKEVLGRIDPPSPLVQSVTEEKPQLASVADKVDVILDSACEQGDNVELDFPDGGLRAWLIVAAAVCVTASTFGVVNSFVQNFLHLVKYADGTW
jgi:hypothetical protein